MGQFSHLGIIAIMQLVILHIHTEQQKQKCVIVQENKNCTVSDPNCTKISLRRQTIFLVQFEAETLLFFFTNAVERLCQSINQSFSRLFESCTRPIENRQGSTDRQKT